MSSAHRPSRAKVGDVIAGRYRIERLLGAGGMGEVFEATQLNLGRSVALKVLLPRYAVSDEAVIRFEREARVAAAIDHPGVIRVYDWGESSGAVYLAMELLRGHTLRTLVGPTLPVLPLDRTIAITSELASVLVAAHAVPLVHRDLKPENVFLEPLPDGGERVVVVDFGLAFIAGRDDALGRLTQEGIVTGTPDYIAPEQAQGGEVGPPADIYALGCVLFELLTSMCPFKGQAMQVVTQHMFASPPHPSEVRRDLVIPRALEELVLSMLAKRPGDRPTAAEVHAALALHDPGKPAAPLRARDTTGLVGRAARMISTVRPPDASTTVAPGAPLEGEAATEIAVIGALDGELALGLAANGLLPFVIEPSEAASRLEGASAIFAPGAGADAITSFVAHGIPVLSDADVTDMTRSTQLLRAGADEVVPRPVRADELARRLWRAIRKSRKRKKP